MRARLAKLFWRFFPALRWGSLLTASLSPVVFHFFSLLGFVLAYGGWAAYALLIIAETVKDLNDALEIQMSLLDENHQLRMQIIGSAPLPDPEPEHLTN